MSKLETIHAQIEKLREDAKVAAKELFEQGAKEVFEKEPTLVAFRWTQYTPYFNDGDECVFRSHHDYPSLKYITTPEDDGDYEDGFEESDNTSVDAFLGQFNDEDMLAMFGDHQQVTVTREGVESDEYYHD